MSLSRLFLTLLAIGIFSLNVTAQSLLNKTVTVEVKQRPLSEVLKLISRQGNFYFSYISTILPQDSIVTVNARQKTVRQVLDVLFNGDYQYKESGNYIILLKKAGQSYFQVSGVVMDVRTGQRLPNVSVYERQQLISTLTNNDGYFRLRLRDKSPTAAISISKDLYTDTTLLIPANHDQDVQVSIRPATYQLKIVEVTSHQVEKTWLGRMMLSSRQRMQSLNIGGFLADKPYQLSLAPGLGTHGRMGAQVVNKFSFNILGGYAAGVDGVEIAGAFNIVKKDMRYLQIAGLLNMVGGKTKGVQIAGFHNNVLDSMFGVQIAGVSNITRGNQRGVQIAGALETVQQNMTGVQLAGLLVVTEGNANGWQISGAAAYAKKNMEGVQFGSLWNHVGGNMGGVQLSGGISTIKGNLKGVQFDLLAGIIEGNANGWVISGGVNYIGKDQYGVMVSPVGSITKGTGNGAQISSFLHINGGMKGLQTTGGGNITLGNQSGIQVAGVTNFVKGNVRGLQVSSALNYSKDTLQGLQVGGILNYARCMKGFQIGLVNIADTSTGYSLGLLNIVRKGYFKTSLYSTEVLPFNVAVKSGTKKLYSMLLLGFNPDESRKAISFGYGMGHVFTLNEKLSIAAEVTGQNVFWSNWKYDTQLYRFQSSLQLRLAKWVTVFAGPSLVINVHGDISDVPGLQVRVPGKPYSSFKWDDDASSWFGWQAGISLF
ncbi:STN and carboxypeptidase regulatory-like domain-containing protein [Chitinophaga nivalis]|uniref:Secretin/TonB short N-terminal domain-containing protein n=1 Tax=Chitinophaga nivalis TaxID=2991709 RepID=A0ABT3IG72_9BACT|nr:STN and carboxypeptidase regulatory-like domain-containing protein [Chitinophaga nivalis]MCW3467353.1 hypothetical protein [Chitinophaga nivalis]MCW3482955.1 hypothetical protein [Chitinophaga nivalis]